MINKLRRILRYIEALNNKRKLKFEIVVKNKIPRIQIKEKHEKKVKNITRFITAVGILISVVSFSAWYYSLGVAILIFVIGQIFEKIIFTYTIMMVQPLPEKWDGSKWSMMVIGMYNGKYLLAFGFEDRAVADDFFNTILYWNNNELINDKNINICLVLEDKNNYSVHVYPDIQREFVLNSIKETEGNLKYDKYGKNQTSLVMQIDICKVFPNGVNSAFNYLKGHNEDIYVCTYDTSKYREDRPETIKSIRPFDDRKILFKNIKVLKRKQLDKQRDVIEYFHIPKY